MFIPRHPVIEDQFCSYATQSGTGAAGVGGVIAYAGSGSQGAFWFPYAES
jgi:hypothetical protein